MLQPYIFILLSWVFFGTVHSLTASNQLKANGLINKMVPCWYYRLLYNGVAILTFIPVWLALQMAPVQLVGNWHGTAWAGGFLGGLGLAVVVMALSQYDLAEFVGWPVNSPDDASTLRRSGLLRYVRHPLYSGILLLATGLIVDEPSWRQLLFGVCAFVYIRIGIYFEERKLVRVFGDQYRLFRKQVPMLLPSFRPKISKTA
jgi:methanethiol S-methyltransferase